MANRSSSAPVYRYDKKRPLSELNNDVFKKLASLIPPDFLAQCHSASYGTFAKLAAEKKRQKGGIDMEVALHNLSNEDWQVERLVAELMRVDNRLALQELLYFWPAHFVIGPPAEVLVGPGEQLVVDIDVRGFPMPHVEWFFPGLNSAGVGRSLVLDYEGLPFGDYCVKVSNSRVAKRTGSKYAREDRRYFLVRSSEHNAAADVAIDEVGPEALPMPPRGPARQILAQSDGPVPKAPQNPRPQNLCKATRKVALLIVMCNYSAMHKLRAGYNDLPDLAVALTKLGYRVFTLFDLPLKDLILALELYARLLDGGAYGFLYLGGHGERCPSDQVDYLIPVDAGSDHSCDDLLSRSRLLKILQDRRPALNVVVWDTCRTANEDLNNQNLAGQESCDETNLILFMPCVVSQKCYEVNDVSGGSPKVRSALVLHMLDLFANEKKHFGEKQPLPNAFFNKLGGLMEKKEIYKMSEEGVPVPVPTNPVMCVGHFGQRSMWDPVDESSQPVQPPNAVLELWNGNCRLIDGIYPELQIVFDPGLTPHDLRYKFHAHNVLQLHLRSSAGFAFDLTRLRDELPRLGLEADFVVPQRPLERADLCRKLTLHHLQLWKPHPGNDIALPVVLLSSNQPCHVTLPKLHLQQMFEAVEMEVERGRRR